MVTIDLERAIEREESASLGCTCSWIKLAVTRGQLTVINSHCVNAQQLDDTTGFDFGDFVMKGVKTTCHILPSLSNSAKASS